LTPLAITSTGRPVARARNTRDLAIWATAQPIAAAASAEVRVDFGNSRTEKSKPRAASASCTRRALSLSGGALISR